MKMNSITYKHRILYHLSIEPKVFFGMIQKGTCLHYTKLNQYMEQLYTDQQPLELAITMTLRKANQDLLQMIPHLIAKQTNI